MTLFIRSKTTLLGVVFLFNEPGQEPAGGHQSQEYPFPPRSVLPGPGKRRAVCQGQEPPQHRRPDRALQLPLPGPDPEPGDQEGGTLRIAGYPCCSWTSIFSRMSTTPMATWSAARCLSEVGVLLKQSVREEDTVIRYGGDEYTLILVETDAAGAAVVAERIRKLIEEHAFLADEGLDIRVTASLGCACYPRRRDHAARASGTGRPGHVPRQGQRQEYGLSYRQARKSRSEPEERVLDSAFRIGNNRSVERAVLNS